MLNIRFKPHIFVSKNGNLFPSFANFTPVNGENKRTIIFFFLLNNIPEEKYLLSFNFR